MRKQHTTFLLLALFMLLLAPSCTVSRKSPANKRAVVSSSSSKSNAYYAKKLGIEVDNASNKKLLAMVDEWLGVPYKYGGSSKKGTDCSGFVTVVYKEVYGKSLPRSAADMSQKATPIKSGQLKEGDLCFFKIKSSKVSHVGIFLKSGKFAHASTKKGVIVSDLKEDYYKKYFSGAGRIN